MTSHTITQLIVDLGIYTLLARLHCSKLMKFVTLCYCLTCCEIHPPDVDVNMPTVRDMDRHMYIREWSGGILAGCFEVDGRSCFQDGVPDSFEFQLLPEDWDHIRKLKL